MARMFETRVRARLSETDALGVVFYGRYYDYFDLARLEMLRKLGITLGTLKVRHLGFVAAESWCKYSASAKFDDLLRLKVGVERIGNSSVSYAHEIWRARDLIAEGRVVDVMVNAKGEPVTIPADIRSKLARYEV